MRLRYDSYHHAWGWERKKSVPLITTGRLMLCTDTIVVSCPRHQFSQWCAWVDRWKGVTCRDCLTADPAQENES
jgi:hypothetical protein